MTVFLLSSEHLEKGYFDNLNSTYRGTIRITDGSGAVSTGYVFGQKESQRSVSSIWLHFTGKY